jgi:hypothetical protein
MCVSTQIAEEHLIHGSEEALDFATTLRFNRCREYQPHLQIDGDLLQVFRNEVRTVIDIQNVGNPAHLPVSIDISPDYLPHRE